MSSGQQEVKSNKELLKEYEKDYVERLEKKEQAPADLQNVIYQIGLENKQLEKKEYIGFCAFCTMGVTRKEMTYKNNLLFHPACFEQQGSNFPAQNQQILTDNSNAKVELILLKNLKNRIEGTTNPTTKSKPKPRKKTKRSFKKRKPKRRTAKKRRTASRRKKSKRRTLRRRPVRKRRTVTRRKRIKRRSARRIKRVSRRRPARRRSRRRTRRR